MDNAAITTRQKALELNLDAAKYGTFVEIGSGPEVSRWFFVFTVGGAETASRTSGTLARLVR